MGLGSCGQASTATQAHTEANQDPLVFATLNPFTGSDASFGPEFIAGCFPAAVAIAAAGGILGHKRVQCVPVDSRGDPADAVPAAQKMVATTHNLVGILGPSSDEALATEPIIKQAKIPMLADTGQAEFDKTSDPFFYRIVAPDDIQGYVVAMYAYDKGYRRAATVYGNDISSQGTYPTAVKGFKKLGGQVVSSQTVSLDQPSYRSEIQQVVAANPDVILSETDPQTSATFLSQLKEVHALYPLVEVGADQQPWLQAVTKAVGADALTPVYSDVIFASAPNVGPAYDDYKTGLLASAADVPNPQQWVTDQFAQSGFDGVIMFSLAMLAAGTTDPSVYNSFITQVTTVRPGATIVHTFAEGKQALAQGKSIAYVGAIGQIAFDQYHNSGGGFQVIGYGGFGNQPVIKDYAVDAILKRHLTD